MNRAMAFVATMLLAGAVPAVADDAAEPRPVAGYSRFELRDIRAEVKVPPKVITKITTELKLKLDEPMARWNEAGTQPGHAGAVAIDVEITQMKFVSGGKRFMLRAMAGGSSCSAVAKLVDVESGKVLARKAFGEISGAMAGSHTMGAADNLMLDRLAANIGNWVIDQHSLPAAAMAADAGAEPEPEVEVEVDAATEPTTDPVAVPAPGTR
jgi:hypothetical protein